MRRQADFEIHLNATGLFVLSTLVQLRESTRSVGKSNFRIHHCVREQKRVWLSEPAQLLDPVVIA